MTPSNFEQAYAQWLILRNSHPVQDSPFNRSGIIDKLIEALRLSERNLTSLIDASNPNRVLLFEWREELRRVLEMVEK
ncbi:MAG TPA: hypothetical protein VK196_22320 [Magnetospirillum sp.]|nr:hypothetical protein [Magnetospirillum sp.]